MKRSFFSAGVLVACLGFASAGCSQTGTKETTSKSKPGDPTSWSDNDNMPGSSSTSLPKSSRPYGGWSNESHDIERSLGVGQ